MNDIFLSVIIPAYKEANRIGTTLLSVDNYLRDKAYNYEIIVVNDGSPDDTSSVVTRYLPIVKNLKLIDNEVNQGKGYAVNCGMLEARGEYRLFMDADNSVDIQTIEDFLPYIEKGNDVVIGSIAISNKVVEHNGWHRRFFGSISKFVIRNLVTPGIYDTQRGFKLFTKKSAEIIFPKQTIERFGFDIELITIARANNLIVKELPVVWDNPAGSTVTLGSYISTLGDLAKIISNRILGRYSHKNIKSNEMVQETSVVPVEINTEEFSTPSTFSVKMLSLLWQKVDKNFVKFNLETEKAKGKGFNYKDKEFIHHSDLHHSETAFYNLLYFQKVFLIGFVGLYILFLVINWHMTIVATLSIITIVYFIDFLFNAYLIFKTFNESPEIKVSKREISLVQDDELPIYTIFCPLYKEWQVVPQFAKAMGDLDYPKEKLQIVFLLEENDAETVNKIRSTPLPPHFEIIVVPHSNPKTKPKAMNYGLPFVRGEYLVIYDAEDVPEVDQLKKAFLAFKKVSLKTVCIQAKLNFYNIHQNILTRLFTAEYSLWFDLVLPGLQSFDAPIPLGGTSNHFKTSALRELLGWDAFNVTEDADLGMRLAKRGYRTAIVESTTYEEANSDVMNWYNQRSRWIKGYIQTYFVHMRDPRSFVETGSIKDFFIFQLSIGGKILSMFINPMMWVITISYFLLRSQVGPFIESFFPTSILYLGVFSLILGNFLYVYYYMIGCAKRGFDDLIKYVFIIPIYWLGMSIAAWKAMYEIFVKPHYWSKTIHGLHLKKAEPKQSKLNSLNKTFDELPI